MSATIEERRKSCDARALRIAGALREATGAKAAILFGSRARGDHSDDSDVDILLIGDGEPPARDWPLLREMASMAQKIAIPEAGGVDTGWMTPAAFHQQRPMLNSLAHEVARDGVPAMPGEGMGYGNQYVYDGGEEETKIDWQAVQERVNETTDCVNDLTRQADENGIVHTSDRNFGYIAQRALECAYKAVLGSHGIEYPTSGRDGHNLRKLVELMRDKFWVSGARRAVRIPHRIRRGGVVRPGASTVGQAGAGPADSRSGGENHRPKRKPAHGGIIPGPAEEQNMKAVRIHEFGDLDVLRWEDVDIPQPRPHQVLIKVDSSGVNYADIMRRKGGYPGPDLPSTLGLEAAGVIEELGSDVTNLTVGQRVMAMGPQGNAEYVAVNANLVFPYPETTDPVQAGGMPIVFLTAYHLLKSPRPNAERRHRSNPGRRLRRWHRRHPIGQGVGRPRHNHRLHLRQAGTQPFPGRRRNHQLHRGRL